MDTAGEAAFASPMMPLADTNFGTLMAPLDEPEFAGLMAPLGPFEPAPSIAVAVSGGADSLALALLADGWSKARGGSVLGLIVDHGLRPESGAEAAETADRLRQRGISAVLLRLSGLARGPALPARARAARHAALEEACYDRGILHLLFGHHAADQAETVLLRALGGSGKAGLAAMASLSETARVRQLRPLLAIVPGRLRATLQAAGLAWIEDPSNADPGAQRARLRALGRDREGVGAATVALAAAALADGKDRAEAERAIAAELTTRVTLRPEGFAVIGGARLTPDALSVLIRTVSGRPFPPASGSIARFAGGLRSATLAGTRLMPAGRLARSGFLLAREAAAMAGRVEARPGAVWDGRFQLWEGASPPNGACVGALGADAAALRALSGLPSVVLQTLPAIRCDAKLFAVPHLGYPNPVDCSRVPLFFRPSQPAARPPFGTGASTGPAT